ncbi:MAG: M67 family metallopeptidase [Anaerolineales bacterium]
MKTLTLTRHHLRQMVAHVAGLAPQEACGLLAGTGNVAQHIFFISNQAQSPTRYLMNPVEQLRAFEWIDENHLDLLAIFHSHPRGPQTVSPTDIAQAAYRVAYLVLSPVNGDWRARGFWIEDNAYREVELNVV